MITETRKCPVCPVSETDMNVLESHIRESHSWSDIAESLQDDVWSTYVSHPASRTAYQEVSFGMLLFARVTVDGREVVSPSVNTDEVYAQYNGRVRTFLAEETGVEEGAVRTRPSGPGRVDVFRGETRKGYVVSHLGAFSAFTAGGNRIKDGSNLMWSLKREAVQAVAGS